MENTLEFELKSSVVIDIDELAEELENCIIEVLQDYQGITDEEMDVVDLPAVAKAVARKWLGE